MTSLESLREKLGITEPWIESRGTHWLDPGSLSVRQVAQAMNQAGARFITVTASQLPVTGSFRLEYHWDLEGRLLGIPFSTAGHSVESIFDLCEAADWIEREIHEEYLIDFTGRTYEPLLVRTGDKLGLNLRDEAAAKPAPAVSSPKEVAQ